MTDREPSAGNDAPASTTTADPGEQGTQADRGGPLSAHSREALWERLYAPFRHPPRGPFRPSTWRSPLRGPWLTSVFGSLLLVGIPIMFITGLVSYAAYNPRLPGNDPTPTHGALGFYLFNWITSPSWIYRVSQGIHVILGFALTPIVLAKLWSVMPKFFSWPPVRSMAMLLERLSVALLVGGVIFELFTGIFNVDYFYFWNFSFYDAHLYGAWAFMAGFAIHVGLKFPTMLRSLRSRRLRDELRCPLAATRSEPIDEYGLVATSPAAPTMSRRGLLGLVGGMSAATIVLTAGENVGGWTRSAALLAPRGRSYGSGPTDFQINKPAASVGVTKESAASWTLELVGAKHMLLSRQDLLTMPQSTQTLPIACVEGWATEQTWTGIPLAQLARMAGVEHPAGARVDSLQGPSGFGTTQLSRDQVLDSRSLLALKVNGADLSLDHGFPARNIIPAAPGVHNTKWVNKLTFIKA